VADQRRSTKRERREEAKRRRLEELRKRQQKARMRKVYMTGGGAVVVVGIILLIILLATGGGEPANAIALARAAGCDAVQNPKALKGDHIAPPATARYNSNPPASGAHYNAGVPNGPTTSGIHRAFVPYELSVHNLEHGQIVIHYKEELSQTLANELAAVVKADPRWVVLIPNPNMPNTVAFTAWGHLQQCPNPTDRIDDAAKDFIKRFKDKAPESIQGTPEVGTDTAIPIAGVSPGATPTATSTPTASPSPTATGTPT
jgi:hypothetical protein